VRALVGFLLGLACATANAQTTLSASPANVQPGGNNVTATWSGIATPTATDWVGVYSPGATDTQFWTWRYTSGAASGSVPVTLTNVGIGTYELRLFANNGYTRLATSNTFTVSGGNLTVSPGLTVPGGSVSAAWSAIAAPSATDWIGLYTPGASVTAPISWQYTNGAASGNAPYAIPAGLAFGTYELRLFSNNTYLHLATSNSLAVGPSVSGTISLNASPLAGVALAATNGGSCSNSNASGQYSCIVPLGWSGSITPSLAGYTFTPASRSYTNVTANQTAQSYAAASAAAALFFIHVDHLNTPRLVANQSGQTVWRWDQQEPFGVNVPDENPSALGMFEFPLGFIGTYRDKETGGNFYNWNRTFDPAVGRYLQSDPIGLLGGLNTYLHLAGNPLSNVDSMGLANEIEGNPQRPPIGIPNPSAQATQNVAKIIQSWFCPPDCFDLQQQIDGSIATLRVRYLQMTADVHNLYCTRPFGAFSWMGHQFAYNNERKRLGKLVAQAKQMGCPYNSEADGWINRPPPTCPAR
jgi:RHS repeat-associated protein